MNADLNPTYDYQVGGSLPLDSPTYVKRQADFDFYAGMMAGEFCYVLNSRQMGKSSLRVQTMRRLQSQGVACASVDLTAIGSQNITPDQWYAGITYSIANSFNLLDRFDLGSWWCDRNFLSPVQRLGEFINTVLLPEIPQKIAIFIDEIDSIKSLNFSVDDFFALIRSCYNKRADRLEYKRLIWALLGVATPSELMQDKNHTPFNIGRSIDLTGFQLHESVVLAKGLGQKTSSSIAVLRAILSWTGGKPFLTQKLCKLALHSPLPIWEDREAEWVEDLVRSRILDNWEAQDEPEHLKTIRDRILGRDHRTIQRLEIYQKLLLNGETPAEESSAQMDLRLAGLVVKQRGKLRVYNRIYRLIFNHNWVHQQLKNINQGALIGVAIDTYDPISAYVQRIIQQQAPLMTITTNSPNPIQRPTNSDEQLIYNHFLGLVKKEAPARLIERFRQLFIEGIGYPEPEIEAAVYRIIGFLENEKDFNYILNRCCYILINRWQTQHKQDDAIAKLVGLFQNPTNFSKFSFNSRVIERLQQLINGFVQSEEYLTLKRLVQLVDEHPNGSKKTSDYFLGQLISRYPYLYTHCLLLEESSQEHRQTVRRIQAQKQRQFEQNLAQYLPHLLKRVKTTPLKQSTPQNLDFIPQSPPSTGLFQDTSGMVQSVRNPTLLSDNQLYLALKHYGGKVEESYSYKDLSQSFLTRISRRRSYAEFKSDLYQYLISSINPKYGKHQFNERLYKFLKNTFPERDRQKVDELLIMRTCSHLFDFMIASPHHPNYYIFIDLISNLGTISTTGFFLKIALLSHKVKPYLEQRFSSLFSYYEAQGLDEIIWLVHSLENLNLALVVNFGEVDLSIVKNNFV